MKASALALTCGVLLYAAFASHMSAVNPRLHGDEHQFLGGAAVVASGMQPYRDFAYFHMPNLLYVYRPLFWSSHPFAYARFFNASCAFVVCVMLFFAVQARLRHFKPLMSAAISGAGVILFCNSDLFQNTAGRAWNQSSALLCAVLATLLLFRWRQKERQWHWLALSGFSVGMAAGIRLSFAPLILPFLIAVLSDASDRWRERLRRLAIFSIGGLVANLPAIYFSLTSPRNFFFGQFGYRHLNDLYIAGTSSTEHSALASRLRAPVRFLFREQASAGLTIFVLIVLVLFAFETWRHRRVIEKEIAFCLGAVPFVLIGSVAPVPIYVQYLFQVLPFLLLVGMVALSSLSRPLALIGCTALFLSAGASFFHHGDLKRHLGRIGDLWQPKNWVTIRVAERAASLREIFGPGTNAPVLTLSPIYALEIGAPIVPEFATGPFAWRVSSFVSREEAAAYKMPWSRGIDDFLREHPNIVGVTGKERPEIEEPLLEAFTRCGYTRTPVADGLVAWQSQRE